MSLFTGQCRSMQEYQFLYFFSMANATVCPIVHEQAPSFKDGGGYRRPLRLAVAAPVLRDRVVERLRRRCGSGRDVGDLLGVTCHVCSCCARACLRAVSSAGMPHALPTMAMLRMQSSASSLLSFFRCRIMASFANCSCNALAFSIVILNPPSVFWALPVSTQWHIHSECLSSNTNKKACSNSTFCREQKRAAFPKNSRKSSSKRLG